MIEHGDILSLNVVISGQNDYPMTFPQILPQSIEHNRTTPLDNRLQAIDSVFLGQPECRPERLLLEYLLGEEIKRIAIQHEFRSMILPPGKPADEGRQFPLMSTNSKSALPFLRFTAKMKIGNNVNGPNNRRHGS